jgi:hypothetical protein
MDPIFQPDGLPEYETRHRHHVTWCHEWQIDELFAKEDGGAVIAVPAIEGSPSRNPLFPPPAYDSDPAGFDPGSIRLLSYSVTGESGRPTYVLLLGEWDAGWSWFMPFSTFTAPATDWELQSDLDPEPLQVLQVWNARSCPNEILERSWFVTRVEPSLVGEARSLYGRMVNGDGNVPLGLVGRIGTRVLDPSDPRMDYLKAEAARLDYLTGLSMQHEEEEIGREPANVVPFVVRLPQRKIPMVLAAAGESPDRELAFHTWEIEGTSVRLHLMELLGRPDSYTLRVEGDSAGILEEARIFDGDNAQQGIILMGSAGTKDAPLRFAQGGLLIKIADGQSVRLVPHQP